MCGICGFFYRELTRPLPIDILDIMVDKMAHRGPDGRGVFYAKNGVLGHRRLTIIDLVSGQQPMTLGNDEALIVPDDAAFISMEAGCLNAPPAYPPARNSAI